ncbi:unnamed protein product [Thelazia callipaeda]|uniref:Uncharacterized protein n=1 Tax=Thelazia callipaeda TaxID=103827 RepID=A0A0N5DAZ8_THECL|nr:unnamed protein product [Thelazia callipaeda]
MQISIKTFIKLKTKNNDANILPVDYTQNCQTSENSSTEFQTNFPPGKAAGNKTILAHGNVRTIREVPTISYQIGSQNLTMNMQYNEKESKQETLTIQPKRKYASRQIKSVKAAANDPLYATLISTDQSTFETVTVKSVNTHSKTKVNSKEMKLESKSPDQLLSKSKSNSMCKEKTSATTLQKIENANYVQENNEKIQSTELMNDEGLRKQ